MTSRSWGKGRDFRGPRIEKIKTSDLWVCGASWPVVRAGDRLQKWLSAPKLKVPSETCGTEAYHVRRCTNAIPRGSWPPCHRHGTHELLCTHDVCM
eukprot:8056273-Pyramimonas_sp.AAC.1